MTRWAARPLTRRGAIVVFAAALVAACLPPSAVNAAAPVAACEAFRVRPQDEIWVVNTRWLGRPEGKSEPAWTVWRFEPKEPRWLAASAAEFYGTDSPQAVTAIYVHGNRVDSELALSDGLDVYFHLAGKFDDLPPVRFVIWSWPSEQIHGQLRDVRAKAARTDGEAFYLASFIAGMQPDVRVGLVGFSFGTRIITGGMHLLGGGQLLGLVVPAGPRQVRVALWAAAVHDHWLLPGEYHGQALALGGSALDGRWFITYNCCDPVLALYRFIDSCKDAVALGYSGLYGRHLLPPDVDQRIEEMNVSQIVGRTHQHEPYLYSSPIIDRTRATVLWLE